MLKMFVAAAAMTAAGLLHANAAEKPTVVLVHGAFADASSWNGVITRLEKGGYPVVAVANPLRSVTTDGDYVRKVVAGLKTDVVLVGHSYGGSVINEAAAGSANVKSLVFVAAFAPDVGETAIALSGKFPGSTLAPTLAEPVLLDGGVKDLYIKQSEFHDQFAADVSKAEGKLMAATQRPVTDKALGEASASASWKNIPSWFVYGDADKNIPPAALAWMAERAGSKETVVVKGASHVVMVSHPDRVAKVIEDAASNK
ncbi:MULTISPECIES: alpha/beta fold hydrolase [unclassified Rhizobium]|uniref:alpha/beta fold hydrolase n=1 Tax=unclassified Rhizobium TaxID=2613769 RepID=UPI0007EAC249|nr:MULTISPECIES: alpha/beta hydrolase [unclassified Rhizobium]ANM14616.1 alpha/beta hydrolase family protein [Rhizobium sp. N324]ANM21005.1 alpha/beta hydrolase family protein [Rhizobium sp. N541]ANM27378.1 alpha/beta hydrolase family protein [Rhizobium sp. N941]OYC99721.1 alpha/beta hydrolase family protein [Rhizobium sp. N4311]